MLPATTWLSMFFEKMFWRIILPGLSPDVTTILEYMFKPLKPCTVSLRNNPKTDALSTPGALYCTCTCFFFSAANFRKPCSEPEFCWEDCGSTVELAGHQKCRWKSFRRQLQGIDGWKWWKLLYTPVVWAVWGSPNPNFLQVLNSDKW